MTSYKLGKRAARSYTSDHTPIANLLKTIPSGTIPPIPKTFGHGYDFGATSWGMQGNGPCDDGSIAQGTYAYNGAGDCADAAIAHIFMEAAKDAGRPVPKFTCASTLDNYAEYLGVGSHANLNSNNDEGTDLQDFLKRLQTTGFSDANGNVYKIGATVSGTPGNLNELWAMTYLFEAAYIGVNLQEAQESAFPKTWNYDPQSQTIGGHCIPIVGTGGLISWGDRVGFTTSFFENLCDEFYGFIDPLLYSTVTGETLEKQDDADLEKYIALLTQVKAS
jgi:hypothetical protein